MTTAGYGSDDAGTRVAFGNRHEFDQARERLWEAFYRMSSGDRFATMISEGWVFICFAFGMIGYSFVTPYYYRVVELFDITAQAQPAAQAVPQFGGLNKADWVLLYAVIVHFVLLLACIGCFAHMLLAKKKNTWVAKTGTFLFGFLVKSVTGFVTG